MRLWSENDDPCLVDVDRFETIITPCPITRSKLSQAQQTARQPSRARCIGLSEFGIACAQPKEESADVVVEAQCGVRDADEEVTITFRRQEQTGTISRFLRKNKFALEQRAGVITGISHLPHKLH